MNDSTEDDRFARMWDRLRVEMELIIEKKVGQIPPYVVLGYMDFIEQGEK